jgi:hypothetical protein
LRVRANKGCHWVDSGAQRWMRNMFACLYTPLCRMRVLLCCACCAPRALHADVCRACQRIRRLPPPPCCIDDSFGVDAAWGRATVLCCAVLCCAVLVLCLCCARCYGCGRGAAESTVGESLRCTGQALRWCMLYVAACMLRVALLRVALLRVALLRVALLRVACCMFCAACERRCVS